MKYKKLSIFSSFLLLTVGCSFANTLVPTPETTFESTPVLENASATNTQSVITPSQEPILEPTLEPTPTAAPLDSRCVELSGHEPLPETYFENYPNVILSYLNEGAAPTELETELFQQGILARNTFVKVIDLTGDLKDDLILSIIDSTSLTVPPAGALLIFTCQGSQYALTHIEQSGEFFGTPILIHIQDMNVDGYIDVIFSSPKCGAHTCFEDTQILSWSGFSFEKKLDGSTSELPSPNIQITDFNQDGIYDFEVVSGGYGSAGAGPQRSKTLVWRYDDGSGLWVLAEESLGASNYRIHMIHDADAAMRRGEYQVALLLYDQAINNANLLDWQDPPQEQLNLGAYARFKIVVGYAFQDDVNSARSFLDNVKGIYPRGIAQLAFMDMAELFLDTYEEEGAQKACEAVVVFAAEKADIILAPLGQGIYGYANPNYNPFDICP